MTRDSFEDCLVVIPTYDEVENLPVILRRLFTAVPTVRVLVVDDASPDGTGELADEIAETDHRVEVLHRTAKDGLGAAYVAGFRRALEADAAYIVELDADGSHPPETLPALLADAEAGGPAVGLVIGSRWMRGGRVVDWPRSREALSRAANLYARLALRVPVRDVTAGYRVYRRAMLEGMDLSSIDARGYFFQVDMTLRTLDAGYRVVEHPIVFTDRRLGVSKMSGDIVAEAMLGVTRRGVRRWFRTLRPATSRIGTTRR